jgi:hypothetical protein
LTKGDLEKCLAWHFSRRRIPAPRGHPDYSRCPKVSADADCWLLSAANAGVPQCPLPHAVPRRRVYRASRRLIAFPLGECTERCRTELINSNASAAHRPACHDSGPGGADIDRTPRCDDHRHCAECRYARRRGRSACRDFRVGSSIRLVRSICGRGDPSKETRNKAILAFLSETWARAVARMRFSPGFEINDLPSSISAAHPCAAGNAR